MYTNNQIRKRVGRVKCVPTCGLPSFSQCNFLLSLFMLFMPMLCSHKKGIGWVKMLRNFPTCGLPSFSQCNFSRVFCYISVDGHPTPEKHIIVRVDEMEYLLYCALLPVSIPSLSFLPPSPSLSTPLLPSGKNTLLS